MQKRDVWLCCGWNYLRIIWAGKAAQDWLLRVVMVPGNGWHLGAMGAIEELQSPYDRRGRVGQGDLPQLIGQ